MRSGKILACLAGVLLLLIFPKIGGIFAVLLLTEILIFSLFALSFNLLFGYTGLLSFGHAAFFGLGGYAAALAIQHMGLSMLPVLTIGIISAAAGAMVIGFFCVRLDEIYFAMLTLGFGMMVFTLTHQWRGVTGGSDGITGFELPQLNLLLAKLSLFSPVSFYYFTVVLFVISAVILWLISRSPFGLILTSMRENSQRVAFVGINTTLYRWLAFVIAGLFAGLAGALFACYDRMASPSMVHWTMSAKPVLMTILGGSRIFLGPVAGAVIFFLLEHFITQYTQSWMIFLGAILIPIVLFFPRGVLGTVAHWSNRALGRGTDG